LLCMGGIAHAELSFPLPTGPVVDDAKILSPETKQDIEKILTDYGRQSSAQIVLVTVPSLQGTTIADYASQLGVAWGIGKKNKSNGILIVVAPHERQVRIEVGEGLENALTDAMANRVIDRVIMPELRLGDMQKGVTEGVQVIVNMLSAAEDETVQNKPGHARSYGAMIFFGLLLLFIIAKIILVGDPYFRRQYPALTILLAQSNIWSGARSGGVYGAGFGGDGFSKDSGSFGGGGASGGW